MNRGRGYGAVPGCGKSGWLRVADAVAFSSAVVVLGLALESQASANVGAQKQSVVVRGVVQSALGEPIEGAVVSSIGTVLDTTSLADGRFELSVELPARLLVVHELHRPLTRRLALESDRADLSSLVLVLEQNLVRETLLVTGEPVGGRFSPNSASSVVVDPLDATSVPSNLSETVTRVSGVAENGQGGLFQVFSIRGISRQRVLSLLSGARLTGERRAGVGGSFLDPTLIGEVDVLRGPASTYYGSGALGGAIQVEPRRFEKLSLGLGYDSAGDENYQTAGWGDGVFSVALARRAARDSRSADGERLFSRFEQISATARGHFEHGTTTSDVLLVASHANDIGKPNSDFPQRMTIYPQERHGLLRYALTASEWRARLFVHPHDLSTEVVRVGDRLERVENDSFDYGGGFVHQLPLGEHLDGRAGVELFGRRGVDAMETTFDSMGVLRQSQRTLAGAEEREIAGYGVVNGEWRRLRWEVGGRGTLERQRNDAAPGSAVEPLAPSETRSEVSRSRSAVTGFVGLSLSLTERVQLVGNLGTGLRFPSLSEQFFSGATGRGGVVGNPDLEAESSLNQELGLRWFGDHAYLGAMVFRNQIDDYIERIEITPDLLTYANLLEGRIRGVELDGFVDLGRSRAWRLSFAGHRIEGDARGGGPLADVPADELRLGARRRAGRWSFQTELEWRNDKDEVGPGERPIASATILEASLGFRLTPEVELTVLGRNLADDLYLPSADDKAVPAAGRSIGFGFRWTR